MSAVGESDMIRNWKASAFECRDHVVAKNAQRSRSYTGYDLEIVQKKSFLSRDHVAES